MPLGDGTKIDLYDQMMNPHVSPSNASIVDTRYDPFGGMTREESLERYYTKDPSTGEWDWDWPPNNGAVPGSETRRLVTSQDTMHFERIGGNGGSFFSPLDTPMGGRALPPDRLNFARTEYTLDTSHPAVTKGDIMIETSEIAPWFGQPGGDVQYRFFSASGQELTQGDLVERGVLIAAS